MLVLLVTMLLCSSCAKKSEDRSSVISSDIEAKEDVYIIYTNDVHSYINNEAKDDDGNTVKLLTYASVKAIKDQYEAEGKKVLLVDCGDAVQGTAYGSFDQGESVIELMNATGYDLATLGNHEFDYGQFRLFELMEKASFPYVSCNFYSVETDETVLEPYKLFDIGGLKIAFIGISTPDTINSSTPAYFQNEKGEYIYGFRSGEDGSGLYKAVQDTIDAIGDNADYIIGLGHLGVDGSSIPYTSREVIENTSGLDAFIDGHSHTVMQGEIIKDKNGNDVLLTQTGSYLTNIGVMKITADGEISTELVNDFADRDEKIDALTEKVVEDVETALGEKIAVLENNLYITDEAGENRLIRYRETNLGDLISDSVYYYINKIEGLNCDVALVNGGGIRANVEAGDINYLTSKTIQPFGNVICLLNVTGQQIKDMLEYSTMYLGITSDEGKPYEFGGYLHFAGLTYEVDTSYESTIVLDEDGGYKSGPTGEYRVSNIMIYNKDTGVYEELDLNKTYAVGGINYILRNGGNGYNMFDDNLIKDYIGEDYLIAAEYLKMFDKDADGEVHISNDNAPVNCYNSYLFDYENPVGSGRVIE